MGIMFEELKPHVREEVEARLLNKEDNTVRLPTSLFLTESTKNPSNVTTSTSACKTKRRWLWASRFFSVLFVDVVRSGCEHVVVEYCYFLSLAIPILME